MPAQRRLVCPIAVFSAVVLASFVPRTAVAQENIDVNARSGLIRPAFNPPGEWLQVLTVTDNWLVLQNELGQQFPVSLDAVRLFAMRWPTSLETLSPVDLVEVTGLDIGSNRVSTDHIDIYKGSARSLVTPTVQQIVGYNRVLTYFDIERQNALGFNYQYLLTPEELRMPYRLHIVSSAVNIAPLQLSVGGNNAVAVLPDTGGMTMSEVTRGAIQLVRPGDIAFVQPILEQTTPRSLMLNQLVVYKSVPVEQMMR
jgi:hypothetical protein